MKVFDDLIELNNTSYGLLGLTNESFCVYVNELFKENDKSIVILTSTLLEANNLLNSMVSYNEETLFFPMDDFLMSISVSQSPELKVTRLETLNELMKGKKKIVITHLNAFLKYLPSHNDYKKSLISLKKGMNYPIKKLVEELYNEGYKRDTIVYKTGDIAVRGFILDVFPIGEVNPIRIEYFGDEIESIRIFDNDTQLSIKDIDKIDINPANDNLELAEVSNIMDYVNNSVLIIKDFTEVKNTYKELEEQIKIVKAEKNIEPNLFTFDKIDYKHAIHYLAKDNIINGLDYKEEIFIIKEVPQFNENLDAINTYLKRNYGKTIIVCLKQNRIKEFAKYLDVSFCINDIEHVRKNHINLVNIDINQGFEYEDIIILTDKEMFGIQKTNRQYRTKFKYSTNIKNLSKLEIGDAIVHNTHGIGIYNGIKTLEIRGNKKDYLEVLYKGQDKLYVPVEEFDRISKYTGKDGIIPRINSLSGTDWAKTKARVKGKVQEVARQLLQIYAYKAMQQGIKFDKDNELQLLFEEEFPYEPTKDQIRAITQIKEEMETSHPMDRLLCGDVGFGKTEVAFRAIFKAINSSKQVLYLCPTTILSLQIYNNAKERFKNFPISIGLLNRFTSQREANRIIDDLNEGKIDFVIGTHRILNDRIKPKKLGLLVIDEEQRFGVTHKEKIRKYKANIDVLTLTATPIPRTLQMSLTGLRSLSLIETPPINRYPIQTYVVEENNELIKQAIYKELARDGQVYILYNHVDLIEKKVHEIKAMVPEAKIIFAHGQMDKTTIENRMIDFTNHKADILICTTIIETGIDIPNVNTLIILESDHFGLSQLYQIRGRVGRSDKIAYSYMMYKRGKVLTEEASKRLNAIKEFTELGSGFKIASRDLSIRGAGQILGEEQSGFIDTVGIDLYLKLLNEEVERLKGKKEEEEKEDKKLIQVSTHIDDKYAEESELKIEIHKMINDIDSYNKLVKVKKELEDRFGKLDSEILIYMYEEWFSKMALSLGIEKVVDNKVEVNLYLPTTIKNKIPMDELFIETYRISKAFSFKEIGDFVVIRLDLVQINKHHVYYLIELVKLLSSLLKKEEII